MTTPTGTPAADPAQDADYQQYLAFKRAQAEAAAGGPTVPAPADERPPVHWIDVLKQLVSLAPLASEAVQREYHAVLDEARTVWDSIVGAKPSGSASNE